MNGTSSAVVGSSALEFGLAGKRHRDHHALSHSAELVRVFSAAQSASGDADGVEQAEAWGVASRFVGCEYWVVSINCRETRMKD